MKLAQIKEILGGDVSSKNSKMPGTTFGLSVYYCNVGTKLRDIEGSVCASCYAKRLEDFRPSVHKGWTSRAEALKHATTSSTAGRQWVQAMVTRLLKLNPTHHRWHDSGDLLNYRHLELLVLVAKQLPEIKFWLPTKEKSIVNEYIKARGALPDNLNVRLSAAMVDEFSMRSRLDPFVTHSGVSASCRALPEDAWVCPARHQGNSCGDCRACWDKDVRLVVYPKH